MKSQLEIVKCDEYRIVLEETYKGFSIRLAYFYKDEKHGTIRIYKNNVDYTDIILAISENIDTSIIASIENLKLVKRMISLFIASIVNEM